MDEYKRTNRVVWYNIPHYESQHQSHIQKRCPKRTLSAKVYQAAEWQQYRCLLTAVDYHFVFSVEHIGSIQVARVYHKQTNKQSENRHRIYECACARMYEWKQVWL